MKKLKFSEINLPNVIQFISEHLLIPLGILDAQSRIPFI